MKQWFIVHVYSGQEHKVANLIKERIAPLDVSSKVEEVIVPTKKTSKLGKEGRVEVEKKLYPGYVAIHMEPSRELLKLISRTPGVLSFGRKGREPQLISEEEKNQMFGYIKPEPGKVVEVPFTKGESVKIIDGPFADFTGTIEEVDTDKGRIKLMVTIFGRQTPIEVSFLQVEPI